LISSALQKGRGSIGVGACADELGGCSCVQRITVLERIERDDSDT
jgi:hypothetical protein